MTDFNVARLAYVTAKKAGASDKIILALFEAGLVESNFTNHTKATDHDSLGYLQQRPSAGWPNPTDIVTATNSFVKRAKENDPKYMGRSAGELAQSVQRSAFPEKYNQRESEARALLLKVQGDPSVQQALKALAQGKSIQDVARDILKLPTQFLGNLAGGAVDALTPDGLEDVIKFFQNLTKKETWVAFSYITIGFGLIVFALFKLTGDNKLSDATKTIAKNAAAIAILRKPIGGKVGKAASAAASARGVFKGSGKPIEAGSKVAYRGKL